MTMSTTVKEENITHHSDNGKGELTLTINGEKKGHLRYVLPEENLMRIDSTFVDPEFRGAGRAAILVKEAVAVAQQNKWSIRPVCSYAENFLNKHREQYKGVLA